MNRGLTKVEELSASFGDTMYDWVHPTVFTLVYPIFSVIRSAWGAIMEAWRMAE